MKSRLCAFLLVFILGGCVWVGCFAQERPSVFQKIKNYFVKSAAPKKQLWSRWLVNDPTSTKTIDNHLYVHFLQKYVFKGPQGVNLVAYAKVNEQDRHNLEQYLRQLSQINIGRYNRRVQEAFWINLYNALTVSLILQHYPVKSILDIDSNGFHVFQKGPWNQKLIKVDGTALSLNDIEHRILRPIWHDSRIHYAVNCASIGCPNLQKAAYTGENITDMLNKAAREYINSPRGVTIKNHQLFVSSIYSWYKDDFGGTDQSVIKHVKMFANSNLAQQLVKFNTISGYYYDWALNGKNAQ